MFICMVLRGVFARMIWRLRLALGKKPEYAFGCIEDDEFKAWVRRRGYREDVTAEDMETIYRHWKPFQDKGWQVDSVRISLTVANETLIEVEGKAP